MNRNMIRTTLGAPAHISIEIVEKSLRRGLEDDYGNGKEKICYLE